MAIGNGVFDEIREQNKKMKDKPLKEKLIYFKDYYLIATLVAIGVFAMIFSLIYTTATAKKNVLYISMINGFTEADFTQYTEDLKQLLEIDEKHEDVYINTNFPMDLEGRDQYSTASIQKFSVQVAAHELDLCFLDQKIFDNYAPNDYFRDLREILTEEEFADYETQGRIVYQDVNMEDEEGNAIVKHLPVALEVSRTPMIYESGAYAVYDHCYLAVMVTTDHPENCHTFINYLETTPLNR